MTLARVGALAMLLLAVDFLDELYAGVPAVGGPEIQTSFGISYGLIATLLFVIPAMLALLVEPPLFVMADRGHRKRFVVGGLLAMGLCAFGAAAAPTWWLLAAWISAAAVASGVGVSLAQATLMDAHPDRREQMMARWTIMGYLGDLAAPGLIAILAYMSLGWRATFVAVGCLSVIYAFLLSRHSFGRLAPSGPAPDEDAGVVAALREAVRDRTLLLWLTASWLCDLLDELLVVFASLHLRDNLGASIFERSLILTGFTAGGLIGLIVAERLLRTVAPLRLLHIAAALCTVSYAAWLWAPEIVTSTIFMTLTGATAAPLYPIVKAQAYHALPDRSGTVQAASHLFTPLSIALPVALGLVADHVGLTAALMILMAQPLGLWLIAGLTDRRHGRER